MVSYTLPPDAVWFITGCSSGIGYTLSRYLLSHTSHRVVATARSLEALSTLPSGLNVLKLALDVTSESSVQDAIEKTLEKWGRIDVCVNNAGYGMHAHTETVDLQKARKLMETNFWSAVRITQLVLPIMRDTNSPNGPRGGLILQMSSGGGRQAFPGGAFYHASKFALEGFTEAVSKEMHKDWNIHFMLIEPGGVKTNYASTSATQAQDASTPHPAYADPTMPTNVLKAYIDNPESMKNWADVEKFVRVLYSFVAGNAGDEVEKTAAPREVDLPLRLPLGSDSYGMQVKGAQAVLEDLERLKHVSCSTSSDEQLKSIGFLTQEIRG